jgi:Rrf2 family nitric oxide-sensitive transcriptional repressor
MTFRKPPDEGGQRSGGQRFYPELARTGGGIRLACSPQDINIGKLIRHTEGEIDLAGCGECRLTESAASGPLDLALEAFFAVLERYTLAQVMDERSSARLLALLDSHGT